MASDDQIKIYTSFYNLYEFSGRIGGQKVEVSSVVPPGAELHGYEPTPRKIADLMESDVFFYVGIGLEPWVDRAVKLLQDTEVEIIKVSEGLDLIPYDDNYDHSYDHSGNHENGHVDDYHGEDAHNDHEHQHEQEAYDPHIWLDPGNVKQIGLKIQETLSELDPDNSDYYRDNYIQFEDKVNKLDEKYSSALAELERDFIMVSHAAFGYLGNRYGFEQLSVTGITPHQEPSPGTVHELVKIAEEQEIDYIFMETLAQPRVVEVIAEEAGLEILILNPLGGLTEQELAAGENYFTIMEENLDNLLKALK